jgi:flagellar hook-associated protein 1 FlgK
MSLVTLLSIARSALLAHQRAIDVTAHNVANAQTPGYSRQRLDLVAVTPVRMGFGALGRGVTDVGVSRARDRLLDAGYRRDSGLLGRSNMLHDMLSQIEVALAEPGDLGVAAALDGLFQSFADLANDPASGPPRELVRQAANRLVQMLHQLDAQLARAEQDAIERLSAQVDEVNGIAERVARLNADILSAGGQAPDLADQRDLLLDQLSELAPVRVLYNDDGTVGVLVGEALLVDRAATYPLGVKPLAGGGWGVGPAAGAGTLNLDAGSLAALSEVTSTTLPGLRSQLDTFTQALVTETNALHRAGFTLTGATGVDFFDPAGVTAGSIALSAALQASTDNLAAAATTAPGDNAVALQLAALGRTALAALGGRTLREYYTQVAAGVGIGVRNAAQDAVTHQALVDNADALRSSVSGVSVDEEMTALIAQQQAYGAAARLVHVAEEMAQTLLEMI